MPRPAFAGPMDERPGDPGTPHDARCATSPYRAVPTRIRILAARGGAATHDDPGALYQPACHTTRGTPLQTRSPMAV